MKTFVFLLLLISVLPVCGKKLERVVAIGGEGANDTFFDIRGAVLSPARDVYIADARGHFIARYNWKGEFIRKTGQKGAGPGELDFPKQLCFRDGLLYVNDSGNKRVVGYDREFNVRKTLRLKEIFMNGFCVTGKGDLVGDLLQLPGGKGRIGVYDGEGAPKARFFTWFPRSRIPPDLNPLSEVACNSFSNVQSVFVPGKKEQIIACFHFPDDPAEFFVFDLSGAQLEQFSVPVAGGYTFPGFFLKMPISYPDAHEQLSIDSLFFYKGQIVFSLRHNFYRGRTKEKTESSLVFVTRSGRIDSAIPLEGEVQFFYLSDDGYLLGKTVNADIEKLEIWRVTD
jgi:hypothetical protein